ncbi:hypothetical protein V22_14990 [Calycomorphotria hydatis]|uniref:Uncharacterized protein n=1 Tax=Calycomorphotria hydatis TaxID=2528027 RepID=A0A517T7C3_9PLAN|nr:hypothetical protein V22_14990 [Calycomorphotria hydatis]
MFGTHLASLSPLIKMQLQTIVSELKSAVIEQWPKLWWNLHSSCETELGSHYPLHLVVKRISNSAAVSQKHYMQVIKTDY